MIICKYKMQKIFICIISLIFTYFLISKNMNASSMQQQDFSLQSYLQTLCKRQSYLDSGQVTKSQLDLISVQKQIGRMQTIQQRTCQQIVQFVDEHRQQFIQIHQQLQKIQGQVKQSQSLLQMLGSRIDDYKSSFYMSQAQIQRYITAYQMRLLRQQVLSLAKTQALFLAKFNLQFQNIINQEIARLNMTQKYLIARFTHKSLFFKALFNHQIVQEHVPDILQIEQILTNLADELEFYLGQQLAKYQSERNRTQLVQIVKQIDRNLGLIKSWYMNMGKCQEYFRVFERNSIEIHIKNAQKLLINNKTSLLSGKDQQLMENAFTQILQSLHLFPSNYPQERLLSIIFTFFKKEQVKFIYTYAMPIFPVSFRSYQNAIENAKLSEQMTLCFRQHHGWNLKMWATVREKNILDRSATDSDMLKWADIIFKSNCMLPGTFPDFLKLAFKVINRHLAKSGQNDFLTSTFNKIVEQHQKLGQAIAGRIIQYLSQSQQLAQRVRLSIQQQYLKTICLILDNNLSNVVLACQNSLESVKSFVSKIIKKDKQFSQNNTINKAQQLFKPLHSFLRSNSQLSEAASELLSQSVYIKITRHYDQVYVSEIYNYSKNQLISQQITLVMDVVAKERQVLFSNTKR